MSSYALNKVEAIATVMRIADVEFIDGQHVSGPGMQSGPLIGEAFKRAINGSPEEFDDLLKAIEALLRPGAGSAQVVTFDPTTGDIVGGRAPLRHHVVAGRHPATTSILQHFEYGHLPEPLQVVSQPFCDLAHDLAGEFDGSELTAGLRKLLEAKDCAVRAALEQQARENASLEQ